MKLSIIVTYHRTLELTKQLLDVLMPQLTEETEVIVIDDDVNTYELDSYIRDNVKVIHHEKNSGCAGIPRNTGLDNKTRGIPFVFIDGDDLIPTNYVEKTLNKIKSSIFNYCLFSWKYIGTRTNEVIIHDNPPNWNHCVWNCIYQDTDERFSTTLKVGEDYDFNVRVRKGVKENIIDILYFYRDGLIGSLSREGDKEGVEKMKKNIETSVTEAEAEAIYGESLMPVPEQLPEVTESTEEKKGEEK